MTLAPPVSTYSRRTVPDAYDKGWLNTELAAMQRAFAQSQRVYSLNLFDFGYKGDGNSDESIPFYRAQNELPATGGRIIVPQTKKNIAYSTKSWNLLKPMVLEFGLPSSARTITATGCVLLFAPDVHGIIVNNYITIDETTRAIDDTNPGANYAVVRGFLILSQGGAAGTAHGGTGIPVDGLKIRTVGVTIEDCWTQAFSRDGVSIRGSVGGAASSVPEIEGSPNTFFLNNVSSFGNGRHGFITYGADCNAGLTNRLNCSNNLADGIHETSFLGNDHIMPHASGNAVLDFYANGVNAHNFFAGSYKENNDGRAQIMHPSMAIGGNMPSDNAQSALSDGFCMAAGIATRRGLQHQNTAGAVQVANSLGFLGTTQTIRAWGSSDDSANLDTWKELYDDVNLWWGWQNRASGARRVLQYPAGNATPRVFAPSLPNGFYYGNLRDAGTFRGTSAAMPATGSYVAGDIVDKSGAVTEAGGAGSKYIVEGWKRITTGSLHVLNTDWFERRTLTGN